METMKKSLLLLVFVALVMPSAYAMKKKGGGKEIAGLNEQGGDGGEGRENDVTDQVPADVVFDRFFYNISKYMALSMAIGFCLRKEAGNSSGHKVSPEWLSMKVQGGIDDLRNRGGSEENDIELDILEKVLEYIDTAAADE